MGLLRNLNKREYLRMNVLKRKKFFVLCVVMMCITMTACQKQDTNITDTTDTVTVKNYSPEQKVLEVKTYELPTLAEEGKVYVEKIEGLDEAFIRGMDVSEVTSLENSGVVYKDEAGAPKDVFEILGEAGINYARIRVWNDPYDSNGKGYGGGNCDLDNAIALGKRATENGMQVLIDFHYSDFWADPLRQLAPKAWQDMDIDAKKNALYEYTYSSVNALLDEGIKVSMVQIGNETNYGMAGETNLDNMAGLMEMGCKAIADINEQKNLNIKKVIHFTDSTQYDTIDGLMKILEKNGVEYDIIGLSYYAYWSGTFEELEASIANIKNNYNKEVMLAEFSYAYTMNDADGYSNSMGEDALMADYSASLQGQSNMIVDMIKLTKASNALGVFYWGGTWTGVPGDQQQKKNAWEQYGSGWASSSASDYDPENVGEYYGGDAWDNQALFDKDGNALESLYTFRRVYVGSGAPKEVDLIYPVYAKCMVGEELELPTSVEVLYNDRSKGEVPAIFDEADASKIDTMVSGKYEINCGTELGLNTVCYVDILPNNLIVNPGFEDEDVSMWNISFEGDDPTDFQNKSMDAHEGNISFHYWSEQEMNFSIEQTVEAVKPGSYSASVFSQGGDFDESAKMEFYVNINGEEYESASFMNDGWVNWKNPIISFELEEEAEVCSMLKFISCSDQ